MFFKAHALSFYPLFIALWFYLIFIVDQKRSESQKETRVRQRHTVTVFVYKLLCSESRSVLFVFFGKRWRKDPRDERTSIDY